MCERRKMKSASWNTYNFNIPGLLYFSLGIQGDSGSEAKKAFVREISYKEVSEVLAICWPDKGHLGSQKDFVGEGALKAAQTWCEEQLSNERVSG